MNPTALRRLAALRPAIKREWEKLLRTEPTLSPLANPDTLVFFMDETLAQLNVGLRGRLNRRWLRHSSAAARPPPHCNCSLNPLLIYYATGELAVRAMAARALGRDIEEALLVFHLMAQKEIEALCGVCCHKGTDACWQRQCALAAVQEA